jgi:Ca-activated chloride channel family protein
MKYIFKYSRYTGEAADDVDLEELIKRLGDFFLQSGFESQYYGVSEFDPDKTMEALRQAILRALAEGDLLPEDLLEATHQRQAPQSEQATARTASTA